MFDAWCLVLVDFGSRVLDLRHDHSRLFAIHIKKTFYLWNQIFLSSLGCHLQLDCSSSVSSMTRDSHASMVRFGTGPVFPDFSPENDLIVLLFGLLWPIWTNRELIWYLLSVKADRQVQLCWNFIRFQPSFNSKCPISSSCDPNSPILLRFSFKSVRFTLILPVCQSL